MSDSGKMKISKMSRTCIKSMIDRYCTLDHQHSKLVYYAHSEDLKPKNTVTLLDCRVTVEIKSLREENRIEEQAAWTEDGKHFRLCLRLKNRNFQPVYYYSESLHQAKVLKT